MRRTALLAIAPLICATFAVTPPSASAAPACPWVSSTAPIPQRVSQVLAQMTIDQKISLLHGSGDSPYVGNTPAIPSLCIPALGMSDGPAGVSNYMTGVTQLPGPLTLAATWDTDAAQRYGAVVGAEEAGKGTTVELGPTVNIERDPRFGRGWETFGEDPYLTGKFGASHVRGVQSQGVMAQVKHMAVYNQETNRNTPADNGIVDTRTLQEIYLPHFETATRDGAASSVMCAYSYLNGTHTCESPVLLNNALKTQFGFPGFVTSDWGATHSTVAASNAGLDQQMPHDEFFGAALKTAVQNGQVSQARLNDMVSRILGQMFTFGLFDNAPRGSKDAVVRTPDHLATARQVAAQGSVLLKNSGSLLPLNGADSIAVLGDDGDAGARTISSGGTTVQADSIVTPFQGIKARAGSSATVDYSIGGSADGNLSVVTVPSSALRPSSGSGNGLTAQYFNNMTLSGTPVLTRTDATVDTDWAGASPGPGVNSTQWSVKWTGTIVPPATGTYTVRLTSDDGSRLIVGGKTVIDQWRDQAATTASGTINLTAGQPVPVEVDFYQNGGDSVARLAWAPPGYTSPQIQQAVDLAQRSDVAVVFAGQDQAEGDDLTSIDLPGDQNQLIDAVAAANPRTIVVLNTGAAVTMPWLDKVAGVVEAWYPGQEDGNAIASVLFGDVNPSGKLPVTFPKSLADVPASTPAQWPGTNGQVQYSEGLGVGYRWYDGKGIAPLFPFGFGLSYTSFSFSNLQISPWSAAGTASVSATVTNTGSRAGAETTQLYVGFPGSAGEPPKQLKGFQRVVLQPGASQTVTFPLTKHDLAYWNNGWTTPAGTFRIMVGDTSANPQLSGNLSVSSAGGNAVTVGRPVGMSSPAGAAASLQLQASGQSLRYNATGLPAGLSINPATGLISGTATTAGTSTVTVTATDPASGAAGNTTFVWTVTNGTAGRTGPIVSGLSSSRCVDDASASADNGTPIQLYSCNGSTAQQWTVAGDGTLRVFGKCMDAKDGATTNGTLIQLYDCNGTGAQQWQQVNGTLRNPVSGRCLDDPNSSTANGTQLVLWDCNNGTNQKWSTP